MTYEIEPTSASGMGDITPSFSAAAVSMLTRDFAPRMRLVSADGDAPMRTLRPRRKILIDNPALVRLC